MLGFLFGAACLVGLVKTARHGCGYGYGGYGHWGHGHWGHGRGGYGGWGRGGYGPGRWAMRAIFERLDTTPGQEKVIQQAAEDVRQAFFNLRSQMQKGRTDVAGALRSEHLDPESLKAVFAGQEAALDELRAAVTAAFSKLHEVLEPGQRQKLADLIEHGPSHGYGYGYGHCHRRGACGGGRGRWRGGYGDDFDFAKTA